MWVRPAFCYKFVNTLVYHDIYKARLYNKVYKIKFFIETCLNNDNMELISRWDIALQLIRSLYQVNYIINL